MVNDELLDKKAAFLADFGWFYGLFLYGKHHQNPLLSSGFAIALYDLIRRHDVTPDQRGRILKLRGYVHKVSNPLPREAHCWQRSWLQFLPGGGLVWWSSWSRGVCCESGLLRLGAPPGYARAVAFLTAQSDLCESPGNSRQVAKLWRKQRCWFDPHNP